MGYIIEKFDDEYFDLYSRQLIEPYSRKMLQDNYEFDAVNFKEIKDNFHLRKYMTMQKQKLRRL